MRRSSHSRSAAGSLRYIFVILLFAISLNAQSVRTVSDGDLSLLIIPKASSLHDNESLLMKVEIMNIGRDVILFRADDLCLNPGAGLTLKVADASGHAIKSSVPLTCVPAPNSSDRDGFIHLAPDAFYGRLVRIQASRIAAKPGKYTLTFTLRGTPTQEVIVHAYSSQKAPIVAFTSSSRPLVFEFPVQLLP